MKIWIKQIHRKTRSYKNYRKSDCDKEVISKKSDSSLLLKDWFKWKWMLRDCWLWIVYSFVLKLLRVSLPVIPYAPVYNLWYYQDLNEKEI
jgi:hypothetical protein